MIKRVDLVKGITIIIGVFLLMCNVEAIDITTEYLILPVNESRFFTQDTDTLKRFGDSFKNALSDPKSAISGRYFRLAADYLAGSRDSLGSVGAELNRYCGYYNYMNDRFRESLLFCDKSIEIYQDIGNRGLLSRNDSIGLANILTTKGLSLQRYGKGEESIAPLLLSLHMKELIYIPDHNSIVSGLVNLSASYLYTFDYSSALNVARRGINITLEKGIVNANLSILYLNTGIAYKEQGDYRNAKQYFNLAKRSFYEATDSKKDFILSVYNTQGVVYRNENDTLSVINVFEDAINYIESTNYKEIDAGHVYSNFGLYLAKIGDLERGEYLLEMAVEFCRQNFGEDSKCYFEQMGNLAYFKYKYLKDYKEAKDIYHLLDSRIDSITADMRLKMDIKSGLADALLELKEYENALDLYDVVLDEFEHLKEFDKVFAMSGIANVFIHRYLDQNSAQDLTEALLYIEKSIYLADSLKIDMSAEEGKLHVAEKFDPILDRALLISSKLYEITGESKYLDLTFRFSERSKASTLLASTNQEKAINFHIPVDLAREEDGLDRIIRKYTSDINAEREKAHPDTLLINDLEKLNVDANFKRDLLLERFKNEYPEYYNFKHSTEVAGIGDMQNYLNRKQNFIEYFLTDTILYTFIINRYQSHIVSAKIDSTFIDIVKEFRSDITNPVLEGGFRDQFSRIVSNGNYLYKVLIDPIKDYLNSNRLVIAPDGILSYIPFEALVCDTLNVIDIVYGRLPFLFKDYEVEYVYSASVLLEYEGKGKSLFNPALVFAPEYDGELSSDSILLARQNERGPLANIKSAREEAIYVSDLVGGQLYIDSEATESKFKTEAPGKKIIHLAMHTLLNDLNPMFSKMVFSPPTDSIYDGYLNTYEIYDIKLNAKMVVLSSCNTGTGYLRSGEGVISLARGFMYAGSPSVVMALWEVDDFSGSEIVKSFYKQLKRGKSKSKSLRKARERYLKDSDILHSHPYFWCSLVILGEDEPIFYNRLVIEISLLVIILLIVGLRRYYKPSSS